MDKRSEKRLRLAGPPAHTRSIHVRVRLEWSHNQERLSSETVLLLDSGASGAVLSSNWVKEAQVLCSRRKDPTPITDASGNHIPDSGLHYTTTVDMYIGDYLHKMRFEVADIPARESEWLLANVLVERPQPRYQLAKRQSGVALRIL